MELEANCGNDRHDVNTCFARRFPISYSNAGKMHPIYRRLAMVALIAHHVAACSRPYSAWMADSVIARGQGLVQGSPSPSTYLQVGFFQSAILRLIDHYRTPKAACAESDWEEYLQTSTNSIILYLLNASQDTSYPLDRLSTGPGFLHQYEQLHMDASSKCLHSLRESINLQPRNMLGGIVLDDIILQLDLLWTHCRQNDTGLLVHGYDESKNASWANPITGASPIVWDRSLGWYLMALVDSLELSLSFPPHLAHYLRQRLVQLADSVITAADLTTGCWWQVMNHPGQVGNYIESSGSAMFTSALYKAARLGYLPAKLARKARHTAGRCYSNLVDSFLVRNQNGTLEYNGTVSVCSLSSSASYEYYVSQPLLYNSVHGTAAFVLASLEQEMLDQSS
ncbi:hypothetical protein N7532_002154 [Penicillium argentinense]|uniref:Uncharacterized protein n=1 Tax=Penicillium argentinense TaxID=1131581 RepID=A0A9W9G3Z0_9EURO|nr:uncharacterized protein N7532_002154 [Penicillium argentinense]KAJ5111619.1 hypothetical protein N7532_002154 [Penicillium argentinense]